MLMPSIFGENLFNDDWMDFSFPDVDKVLYGKHAKNVMKTDVRETDNSYEVDIDLPGFKKDEIEAKLENGYLTKSQFPCITITPGFSLSALLFWSPP